MVQDQQEVEAREIASDVPDSTLIMHAEQPKLGATCRSSQDRVELSIGNDAALAGNEQDLGSRDLSENCEGSTLRRSPKACLRCCRLAMSQRDTT